MESLMDNSKIIWMYWHQGWTACPSISTRCRRSWREHNPDYKLISLSHSTLDKYIPEFTSKYPQLHKRICLAHYSDMVRLYLLKKYGGVWCDSTLFCMKPLDDWLPEDVFFFSNPKRNRLVANWFISSPPDSYIINKLTSSCEDYLRTQPGKIKDYFWQHHLFTKLYHTDQELHNRWDEQKKISVSIETCEGPHLFCNYTDTYRKKITRIQKQILESGKNPCYKLNHKVTLMPGSAVDYLIKRY